MNKILIAVAAAFGGIMLFSGTVFAAAPVGEPKGRQCPVCETGCRQDCPFYYSVAGCYKEDRPVANIVARRKANNRLDVTSNAVLQADTIHLNEQTYACPVHPSCPVEGCTHNGPHEHNGAVYCGGGAGVCGGAYCSVSHSVNHNGYGRQENEPSGSAQNQGGSYGGHHGGRHYDTQHGHGRHHG